MILRAKILKTILCLGLGGLALLQSPERTSAATGWHAPWKNTAKLSGKVAGPISRAESALGKLPAATIKTTATAANPAYSKSASGIFIARSILNHANFSERHGIILCLLF